MENFSESNLEIRNPEPDASSIISHAFEIYKKSIVYVIVAMIVLAIGTFILSEIAQLISNFDPLSASESMRESDAGIKNLIMMPGYLSYIGLSGVFSLLLFPIYGGLMYIFNKANFNQPIVFSDLFLGYKQKAGALILYGLLSNILFTILISACFLPIVFVGPLFLFALPIVVFENCGVIDAFKKSWEIAKRHYWSIVGVAILGVLLSMLGLIFCIIGVLATAPFIYIVCYSAYCAYFGAPRQIS